MTPDGADTHAWTIVLRPDGVVDDVQGGAPITWVSHALPDDASVPSEIRAAARGLLSENRGKHYLKHSRVLASIRGQRVAVDLVVCHAVPLRRSLVVVRDMIMRVLDLFRQQVPDAGVEMQLDYSEGVPVAVVADGEKITWAISTPGRHRAPPLEVVREEERERSREHHGRLRGRVLRAHHQGERQRAGHFPRTTPMVVRERTIHGPTHRTRAHDGPGRDSGAPRDARRRRPTRRWNERHVASSATRRLTPPFHVRERQAQVLRVVKQSGS
jgi:hypothetical protein